MDQPLSRRSAILRAFAAISAVDILAFDASSDGFTIDSAAPTAVVPGKCFGDLLLGMKEKEVVSQLGSTYDRSGFEATNRTFRKFQEPRPETTFLNYKSKGISVKFVDDRVDAIFAYTGVIAGYEKGDYTSGVPLQGLSDYGRPIERLEDARKILGAPLAELPLSKAPVPANVYEYASGISIQGRMDDGLISYIGIYAAKSTDDGG